jgi:hypothetical protein
MTVYRYDANTWGPQREEHCGIKTNYACRVSVEVPAFTAGVTNIDYVVVADSIGRSLVITNADGSTNPVGVIRLNWQFGSPPVITNISPPQLLVGGTNADLQIGASNPVLYQWNFNRVARSGATNPTLSLRSVQLFRCRPLSSESEQSLRGDNFGGGSRRGISTQTGRAGANC